MPDTPDILHDPQALTDALQKRVVADLIGHAAAGQSVVTFKDGVVLYVEPEDILALHRTEALDIASDE